MNRALWLLFAMALCAAAVTVRADDVTLEGEVRVVAIDDFKAQGTKFIYTLKARDGRSYRLDFGGQRPGLRTGQRIKVRGDRKDGTVAVPLKQDPASLEILGRDGRKSFFESEEAAPVAGSKKVVVIIVKYEDPSPMAAELRQSFFTDADSVKDFFAEESFGQLTLQSQMRADGDVFGPYAATFDTCNDHPFDEWGDDADAAARADGVDLSAYDYFMYYVVPPASCRPGYLGVAYIGGNRAWTLVNRKDVMAHEVGHNLGLFHANGLDCLTTSSPFTSVTLSDNCLGLEYADPFDTMGNRGYHHFNSYKKARLEWLSAANVATWTGDGEFTIAPLERTSTGVQSLRLPRSRAHSGPSQRYFYLEYRQPFGFDNFSTTSPISNGITVRVAPDLKFLGGTYLLDMRPDTRYDYTDAPLLVGQTFNDPLDGYSITVLSRDSSGARVRVTNSNPPLWVNISSPEPGQSVSGVVEVQVQTSHPSGTSKVDFYMNRDIRFTDTSPPFSFSWDTTQGPDGNFFLTAKAYPANGGPSQVDEILVTARNWTGPEKLMATSPNGSLDAYVRPNADFSAAHLVIRNHASQALVREFALGGLDFLNLDHVRFSPDSTIVGVMLTPTARP